MSSGMPRRRIGELMNGCPLFFRGSITGAIIGVSIAPGQMQLTRIFFGPNSTASARDSATIPPFAAVEAWAASEPMSAAIEAVLMIEPPPDLIISGMPYFAVWYILRRLIAMTRSQSASGVLMTSDIESGDEKPTPALL